MALKIEDEIITSKSRARTFKPVHEYCFQDIANGVGRLAAENRSLVAQILLEELLDALGEFGGDADFDGSRLLGGSVARTTSSTGRRIRAAFARPQLPEAHLAKKAGLEVDAEAQTEADVAKEEMKMRISRGNKI